MIRKVIAALVIGAAAVPVYAATTASAGVAIDLELRERFCGSKGSHCEYEKRTADFGDRLIFALPLHARADGERSATTRASACTCTAEARCSSVT